MLGTKSVVEIEVGDVVRFQIASSGGYGEPFERAPAAVLDDVLDELISVEDATESYGVVIDLANMSVDEQATARLRAASASTDQALQARAST